MIEAKDIIDAMGKNAPWVGIAWMGWFAHYIYKVSKGDKFSIARLIINIVLAGWVGFLWQEAWLSPAFISISGFCTYPILTLIEEKGVKIILDLLIKK